MSGDVTDLRTRLEELADWPAPASSFDPARTAAVGRRRVLALRTSAVAGGAALAVAVTIGIVRAFAPAGPLPAVAASGIGADPMAKFADFGWLPASLPNVSYIAATSAAGSDVVAQGYKTPDGAPRVDMQFLTGKGPGTPTADERLVPAKLNDGRQAYWLIQAHSGGDFAGDVQLRFPAEDGRWMSLTWGVNWGNILDHSKISGVPASSVSTDPGTHRTAPTSVPLSAQWQRDLLHMATEVTDTPAQIPMPVRITGLPPSFQPDMTFLWRPSASGEGAPGTWSVLLSFDSNSVAHVEVGPHNSLGDTSHAECTTSAGLDACVWTGGSSAAFNQIGRSKGLLKLITLLGPDEKNWTTDVLVP